MGIEGFVLMKKFVYLAGPIEGCNKEEITIWRNKCYVGFLENIIGINPYRAESEPNTEETRKRIVMKNYMDVTSSDLILATMPREINNRRPSYGTTMEIGWAYSMQKPVVIVSDDLEIHDHPLLNVAGAHFYDLEEAIDYINVLLGEYGRTNYERYIKVDG